MQNIASWIRELAAGVRIPALGNRVLLQFPRKRAPLTEETSEAGMRTLSRRVWLLLGLAMVLVVLLLYLNSRRPSARVAVVQASRETFRSSISSNGKVEPIIPYSLRAKFDGFVDRVIAAEGKNVKKGEL